MGNELSMEIVMSKCIKCNGTMNGDGYTLIESCENIDEEQLSTEEADALEFGAPDEGPIYCKYVDEEPTK